MPLADWTPELAAVGALLRARTKDDDGNELGTFTADTRPTGEQVTALIPDALGDVASVVGNEIPEPLRSQARFVVALGTAMLVELSYFPEQVGTVTSPYDNLKVLYDERLARLRTAMESGDVDLPGVGEPGSGDPQFAFGAMPIVGWDGGW